MEGNLQTIDTILKQLDGTEIKDLAALQTLVSKTPNSKFVNMKFMKAKGSNAPA